MVMGGFPRTDDREVAWPTWAAWNLFGQLNVGPEAWEIVAFHIGIWQSQIIHGAGIFTYKTGTFVGFQCRDSYTSTMDDLGIYTYPIEITGGLLPTYDERGMIHQVVLKSH